jgi:hypothetical protein
MAGSLSPTPAPIITPSAQQVTLPGNYIGTFDFTNQYLPDLEEQEFARYGNRTISGLLNRLSAELPSQSDLIKWEEQGRLHVRYGNISIVYGAGNDTATCTIADAGVTAGAFRKGQTIMLSSNQNNTSDHAIITAVTGALTFTVAYYAAAGGTISASDTASAFVYGSEFKKGSNGIEESLESTPGDIYEVSPVIIKDKYTVAASDMAQIGWIETVTEEGATGYFWYMKSESETRLRYNDYLEMMMVEHREAEAGSGAIALTGDLGNKGTTGLFQAIEDRGNLWTGGNPTALVDWDTILQRFDKQGAIQEYALYNNRQFSLDVTDMLATQSSGSFTPSFGMFNNSEEMALTLEFKGFKRGNYEFYQTDWKYLNDPTLRGGMFGGAINGVMVPVGTMTVYDQVMGQKVTQPFLHVRYRQSANESRKYKSWVLGSAGGAHTSDLDAMEIQFLSERALVTLGANNFMLFEN